MNQFHQRQILQQQQLQQLQQIIQVNNLTKQNSTNSQANPYLSDDNGNNNNNQFFSIDNNLRQQQGPQGANLFICHIPRLWQDSDLFQQFSSFGKILSVKVFLDPRTNQSRGFGFVSYEATGSAQKAILSMNGFQVSGKRLKVQLKK